MSKTKPPPSWERHEKRQVVRDWSHWGDWKHSEALYLPFCDGNKLWDVLNRLFGAKGIGWYYQSEAGLFIIRTDVEMTLDDMKEIMMEASRKQESTGPGYEDKAYRRRRSSSVERELEEQFEIEEEEEEGPRPWNHVKKLFSKFSKDEEEDERKDSKGKKNADERV